MTNINVTFGKRLKELREGKNFTQEYLAKKLNIRTATISDFEHGKISIKIDTLFKLCNILDITIKDFFDFYCIDKNSLNENIIAEINSDLYNLNSEKLNYIRKIILVLSNKL